MHSVAERSRELFESGFYCAESVLLAIAEHQGIESELIPSIATGFCGGMSKTSGLCGALTGGILALNMLYGRNSADDIKSKEINYDLVAWFISDFKERFGSTNCSELLGCDVSTEEGIKIYEAEDLERKICIKITGEAADMVMKLIEDQAPADNQRGKS